MKLPLIKQDKANHFIYGNVLCFFFNLFFIPLVTITFMIIIAVGKEIYDNKTKTGTPELMDVVWTLLGALTILITQITT
jgi:hypothetical protein